MDNSNTNRLVIGLSVLMLLLLAGLLFFWNSKRQLEKEANALIEQKNQQIQETRNQLNIFKGRNAQLDSLLEIQEEELLAKGDEIDSLIKSGKVTMSRLALARKENKRLEGLLQTYVLQIDSLSETNRRLLAEKLALQEGFDAEKMKTSQLMDENSRLYESVSKGKILKVENFEVGGIRYRNNGKEMEATRASKVERIKACFTLLENRMADSGAKDVLLRIISPSGTTLYLEEQGSGKFIANGIETLYSSRKTVNYQNRNLPTCVNFEQSANYQVGSYVAEVYVDGELIGKSNFYLK